MIALRPYQVECIEAVRARYRAGDRSVLIVVATGGGKTTIFAEVARLAVAKGRRVLVLAHRRELVQQAADRIRAVAPDLRVDVEQADERGSTDAHIVVASVQTLARPSRRSRWPADGFALVVVDEAHHATADGYREILAHFASARVLGVTATPDRGDGTALAKVFQTCAFRLETRELIRQGFLVHPVTRTVRVAHLDLDHVRTRGGDFVAGDLARAFDDERTLHEIAAPLVDHAASRPTIVFAAGVQVAHRLASVIDRYAGDGAALALDATTGSDVRDAMLTRFRGGDVRFLVNVGVLTEGFDAPSCSCVAIARPTRSRALFVQMVGRGLRTAPGKVDCLVLNFAPQNARHRLVGPVDALAPGDVPPPVRERAERMLEEDPDLSLDEAIERSAAERARAVATYEAALEAWDAFGFGVQQSLARELEQSAPPVNVDALIEAGVPKSAAALMTPGLAAATLREVERRRREGLCSLRQARHLQRCGLRPDLPAALAARAMASLSANGWRRAPAELLTDERFAVQRVAAEGSAS